MTAEEFAHYATAETKAFELVEGELIPLPSATPIHARIRHNVELSVALYFRQQPSLGVVLAEVDCRIDEGTVRRPAVSIFLLARLQGVTSPKCRCPSPPTSLSK